MPVFLQSFLLPSFPQLPFLLEDKYLRGGFQSLTTLVERDDMHIVKKKPGMLVYVKETSAYYQMSDDLSEWLDASLGGGIGEVVAPMLINEDGALAIDINRILPSGGSPGQLAQKQLDGSIQWVDAATNAGARGTSELECPLQLSTGEVYDFELPLAKTLMLLKVILNAPDIQLTGYTTSMRDDKNPFTFISHIDFMQDEGVLLVDASTKEYKRRFSFMANLETPVSDKLYFTFKNLGVAPVTPKVIIDYLAMQ